jgi:hypothetical protein
MAGHTGWSCERSSTESSLNITSSGSVDDAMNRKMITALVATDGLDETSSVRKIHKDDQDDDSSDIAIMEYHLQNELALQQQAELEAKAQSHAVAAARTKLQIASEKAKKSDSESSRSRSTLRSGTSGISPEARQTPTGREFMTPQSSRQSQTGSGAATPIPTLPILRERKPVPSTPSTVSDSMASRLNAESIHRNEMMLKQKEYELEMRLATEASRLQAEFERQREKDKYEHEMKMIELIQEVERNVENHKAKMKIEAEEHIR